MSLTTFPRGETLFVLTYHHRHGSDTAVTLAPTDGGPLGCVPEGEPAEAWLVDVLFGCTFEAGEELEIAEAGVPRLPRLLSNAVAAAPIWVVESGFLDLGGSSGEATIRWAYHHFEERLVGQVENGGWEPMTPSEQVLLFDHLNQNGWLTPPEGAEARSVCGWPAWAGRAA
jgi:hypothetical protein